MTEKYRHRGSAYRHSASAIAGIGITAALTISVQVAALAAPGGTATQLPNPRPPVAAVPNLAASAHPLLGLDPVDLIPAVDPARAWDPLGLISIRLAGWGLTAAATQVGAPGSVAPGAAIRPTAKVAAQLISSNALLKLVRRNFPAAEVGNAMAVADCESGQQSVQGAVNFDGTTDWGVFQLNDGGSLQGALAQIGRPAPDEASAQQSAMAPAINVKAAAAMWRDRGWAPWVCAYKQQVVSALWSRLPGPMYGRFTVVGKPTGPIPTVTLPVAKARTKPAQTQKTAGRAKPSPAAKPNPAPKPIPTRTPVPTPSPTSTVVPPTTRQSSACTGESGQSQSPITQAAPDPACR